MTTERPVALSSRATAGRPPDVVAIGRVLAPDSDGRLRLGRPVALRIAHGCVVARERIGTACEAAGGAVCVGHRDAVLLPALADSHLHLVATAAAAAGSDLAIDPPRSLAELAARLEAAGSSSGGWVRASGFEPHALAERRPPTRGELDAWVRDRPLRLRHATRHASFLNAPALALLERALGALPAERVPRDASGQPAGVVYGLEREITALVGPLPAGDLAAALRATSAELAARGVARLDDPSGSNDARRVGLLAAAVERGDLVQSVRAFVPDADEADAARRAARGRLAIAGVKLFLHASEDARRPEFAGALARARRAGLPIAVHAVEADCVAAAAEALSAAPARRTRSGAGDGGGPAGGVPPEAGVCDARQPDRIEHASICPPEVVRGLARSGIAVVTQPGFLVARGDKYREEVEPPLWGWLYPLRSLREAGVLVAAGSDAPVAAADPRQGIAGAMRRETRQGRAIAPEEALDERAAVELYTTSAARLRGERAHRTWLEVGAPGDVAVLDRDPRPSGWRDWSATAIVVAGRAYGLSPGPRPGLVAASRVEAR